MFQFLLKLLRKATCDAILGGVDDAMDQLGEINDGSELHMKVTDAGVYILLDKDRKEIARREDYVPDIVPGEYGDYVELNISHDGRILNWDKTKGVAEFFPQD